MNDTWVPNHLLQKLCPNLNCLSPHKSNTEFKTTEDYVLKWMARILYIKSYGDKTKQNYGAQGGKTYGIQPKLYSDKNSYPQMLLLEEKN